MCICSNSYVSMNSGPAGSITKNIRIFAITFKYPVTILCRVSHRICFMFYVNRATPVHELLSVEIYCHYSNNVTNPEIYVLGSISLTLLLLFRLCILEFTTVRQTKISYLGNYLYCTCNIIHMYMYIYIQTAFKP